MSTGNVSTPTRMIGYVRVSRVNGREGDSFISPELQRDKIEQWAALKGIEIVAWFTDLDESGGTQDRPGLKDAILMVERGEADGIVCAYLSRFARNVSGALADIERIHNADGSVAFVNENLDPTTPMGKAMLTILLAFATLERDNVSQSWLDSRLAAIERGVWLAKRPPFGYLKDDNGRLLAHPDEAPIMHETYRLAAEHGAKAAAEYFGKATALVDTGRKVKSGKRAGQPIMVRVVRREGNYVDRPVFPATVRVILSDRAYIGEQQAGQISDAYPGHPALVSRDLWERAQSESTVTRKAAQTYPLSGLATCAECGDFLVGHSGGRYICRSYIHGNCTCSASIKAEALKDYVVGTILDSYSEDGRSSLLVGRQGDEIDLEALQADIDAAEAERTRYAADTEFMEAVGRSAWLEGAKARTEAVKSAQRAYRDAAESVRHDSMDLAPDALAKLEGEDLNRALGAVFAAIIVGPGKRDGKLVPMTERVRLMLHSDAEAITAEDAA